MSLKELLRTGVMLVMFLTAGFTNCTCVGQKSPGTINRVEDAWGPQKGDLKLLRNPMTLSTDNYIITSEPDSFLAMVDSGQVWPKLVPLAGDRGLNMYVNRYGEDVRFRYFEADSSRETTYLFIYDDGTSRALAAVLRLKPSNEPVVVVPRGSLGFLLNRALFDASLPQRLILSSYAVYGLVGDSLFMTGTLKF